MENNAMKHKTEYSIAFSHKKFAKVFYVSQEETFLGLMDYFQIYNFNY